MKIRNSIFGMVSLCLLAVCIFAVQVKAINHFSNWVGEFSYFKKEVKVEDAEDCGIPNIQLALLLDTSSSMSGLINQAKSQLWKIATELSKANIGGLPTTLSIALYEYGNSGLTEQSGWIRQITPFTTDMDKVSQELFSLTISGGSEHCGQVIFKSLDELKWLVGSSHMRIIYISGNEEFTQGPIDFKEACAKANKKGVIINTIYCGPQEEGIRLGWKAGAECAGGDYMSIDHNAAIAYIDSPYDDKIANLNQKLNDTYIPYGKEGASFQSNQRAQDTNAYSLNKVNAIDRAVFKSSKAYNNAGWDLVDAYKNDCKIVKNKKDLPAKYQDMTEEEVENALKNALEQRNAIKQQINDLSIQRSAFVEAARAEENQENDLGKSVLKSVEKQAKKKGFVIKN